MVLYQYPHSLSKMMVPSKVLQVGKSNLCQIIYAMPVKGEWNHNSSRKGEGQYTQLATK